MKVAEKTSLVGFLAIAIMFTSLHFFAIQKHDGNPLLSIPLASLFILMLAATSASIIQNLRKGITLFAVATPARIFLIGYGACTLLVVVSALALPKEFATIPTDALLSPGKVIQEKASEFLTLVADAHWWVHMSLGLALLLSLAVTIGLFLSTDVLGAINATIAGPFVGLLIVAALVLAAYVIAFAVMGAIALAAIYLQLALRESEP